MSSEDEAYFQTRLSYEPHRDAIWSIVTEYLQQYVPRDAVILELGAGYCSFINHVKAREKHALDRSEIIRQYAADNVTTHICNCTELQRFKDNTFDAVFSSFLFEHLTRKNLNRVMSHLRRILKTDGVLITLLPNFKYIARHYFDDYTHIQIFSHLSFSDYLKASGFRVTEVQGRFLPYSFKSRLPKWPWLTRLYLSLPFRPMAGNMLVVAVNPERASRHSRREKTDRIKADTTKPEKTRLKQKQPDRGNTRHKKTMENKPRQEQGVDKKPQEEHAIEKTARKAAPAENTARKVAPAEDTARKAAPIEDTARKAAPIEDTARKAAPAEETPRETQPVERKPEGVQPAANPRKVRHGRRPRRNPADHYGIDIDKTAPRPEDTALDSVETFPIKPPEKTTGTIDPEDVRTPRRRKN